MPLDALANPLVLPVLGLLTEQPCHGYRLYVQLRDRYPRLKVRRSSVYTLLDRLLRVGWVELDPTPDLARYSVTTAGRQALAERVEAGLRDAPIGPSEAFLTAVAYLGILQPERAVALLDDRRGQTAEALVGMEQSIADYAGPELHMVEVHYLAATLRQDEQWLEATVTRIRSGALAWPAPVADPASQITLET